MRMVPTHRAPAFFSLLVGADLGPWHLEARRWHPLFASLSIVGDEANQHPRRFLVPDAQDLHFNQWIDESGAVCAALSEFDGG